MLAKKGEQIVLLDVSKFSSVTDFYLIATCNSTPHLRALAHEVERELLKHGIRCFRRAGTAESGWIVSDYLNFVIHLFKADLREHYQLEELWKDAKIVE
ncbi:MAG: ribosome silencing factor [Kiritimatiellae bacterium]|nr:ribosome silencing factor [Kiritimatiellia bacterium]MCO5062034.1 ribosome silencing factor [Kiritimatiellia bacterium]MCO5069275.1 ribosome silencing factor [Kiritimatiellia bacterium]MCO6401639.1 ribosome silencing factor [Verrucomicrobiota bacterium]